MWQQFGEALLGKSLAHLDDAFGRFTSCRVGGLFGAAADGSIAWKSEQPLLITTVPEQAVPIIVYAPTSGPDAAQLSVLAMTAQGCGAIRDKVKVPIFEDYRLVHDFDPDTYDPASCELPKEMVFLSADALLSEVRFTKLEICNNDWIRQRIMADGDACLWADTGLDHMAWQIFFKEGRFVDCLNSVA